MRILLYFNGFFFQNHHFSEKICDFELDRELPENSPNYVPKASSDKGLVTGWFEKESLPAPKPADVIEYEGNPHVTLFLGREWGERLVALLPAENRAKYAGYIAMVHFSGNEDIGFSVNLHDWNIAKNPENKRFRINNSAMAKFPSFSMEEIVRRAPKWASF